MARKKYSFYIEDTQSDALKSIKARDGVLESEQIRRALDEWIARRPTERTCHGEHRRAEE